LRCGLHEVESLEYSFKQADSPYWMDIDGAWKITEIEIIGPAERSVGQGPGNERYGISI
jgi:hypothetical protein